MTKQLILSTLGMLAVATMIGLSGGVANADVDEVSAVPEVTIDTPAHKGDNAVRAAPYGEVQAQGAVRDCKKEVVCGQGKIANTTKARVGSKASAFNLESDGEFKFDPPIGNWQPLAP